MTLMTAKLFPTRWAASRSGLVLCGVAAALAAATPARALTWTNVLCSPGVECAQTGAPASSCQCGLWMDSPASISETTYVFVQSTNTDLDETGKWTVLLAQPISAGFDTLRARATANDSSVLKIIAYNAVGGGLDTCSEGTPDVAAVLQWGPKGSNIFSSKSAPVTLPVVGLCIILTDEPDTATPVSGRSSAQIDMIQLKDSVSGKMTTLEQFSQTQ